MSRIQVTAPSGVQSDRSLDHDLVIGRAQSADIQLSSWRVSREHARLVQTPSGWLLEDMGGFSGVSVNGHKVSHYGPLGTEDEIEIGGYRLRLLSAEKVLQKPESTQVASPVDLTKANSADEDAAMAHKADEIAWRRQIHDRLLAMLDLRRKDVTGMSDEELLRETGLLIDEVIAELQAQLPASLDLIRLKELVLHEAIGLGPIEDLLADETVSEIMVNRHDQIYIERAGKLVKHPLVFTDARAVLSVIERIVSPLGRRIDESSPMVDARLKDGSRVNAIIPPLALRGPALTIRKFPKHSLTVEDLVHGASLSQSMASFLQQCVQTRKNIVVSGGTGSGKTTLLNMLSNFIPAGERIVTIEDSAELRLSHDHLIGLESRPANAEGKGNISIRDLVKNALRMRPDRIVVGECRGAEALDMLQAMNTGHEGSLTTIHANTPRDAIARLETLIMMAGMDLPLSAIREQISSAVDLIVQQTRFPCGARKIVSVTEVSGMESGVVQLMEIFRFDRSGVGPYGVSGQHRPTGQVPTFLDDWKGFGIQTDMGLFNDGRVPDFHE